MVAFLSLLLPFSAAVADNLSPTAPLSADARGWVDSTLTSMTLEEKAGQMVMLRVYGYYAHPESEAYREVVEAIREIRPGGVVLFQSEVESIPPLLRELQEASELPLLVAADMERGMAFRVRQGTVPLPYAMAVGATRSEEAARFTGEVTAREGKALGIHWALAPVADVNNNPANPVISVRSYGEDPQLVGQMARAFMEGVQDGGLMASAKHFPGHGDTELDSHVALPSIQADRQRLEAIELPPFRQAVEAGIASIMTAHVAVPALDPSGLPATLSPILAEGLLRHELGFQGIIVTDSMGMAGVRKMWTGKATVQAVLAGADVLLLPPDPAVAVQSLVRAVREGQLTEERLDASVLRILEAKARLGLHLNRMPEEGALRRDVARPEDLEHTEEIAAAAVTVVRNEGGILPLEAEARLQLLHLEMATSSRNPMILGIPQAELRRRGIPVKTLNLGGPITADQEAEVLALAGESTHVLASVFPLGISTILPPSHARLLGALAEAGHSLVVTSFGSPYLLRELPAVPVFVCTYGGATSSQYAAMAALFGETEVRGKLPVTLRGGSLAEPYPYGFGLEIPRRAMTLQKPTDDAAAESLGLKPLGLRPNSLATVDQVVEDFLEQKAFPGAVLAVGYRGTLVHLKAFGHLSYDEGAPQVRTDTIYDLASLTKVIATTTMAMMLVDEGKLDLDAPVQDFLPLFVGEGKEAVTVRHLLTHSSGVDWWAPLYKELQGPDAYQSRIQGMDLVYEPGSRSLYSDLGLMLLGEILQRVAGTTLDAFVTEKVFEPLAIEDTLYRPGAELLERIAPTELDADWRGRVLRGDVHDENAFALGGVAPHAGLFGTAPDLARFAQMILNGGVFEHRRYVRRATLDQFTTRASIPDSTRGLGWDTKSEEGSSAGTLFSPSSFGHTGYTGTSLWIDPERQLFVILLTNRVHPTRENILIRQVRPAVADAVVRALAEP